MNLANVELSAAGSALKNKQIDGFVTAGSYPAPNVIEAAAGTGVTVLSLSDEQVKKTKRTRLVIPAGPCGRRQRCRHNVSSGSCLHHDIDG